MISIIVSSHQPSDIAAGLETLATKKNIYCDPNYLTQFRGLIDNMPEQFYRRHHAITAQIFNSLRCRVFDRLNDQHTEITQALTKLRTVNDQSPPHQAKVAFLRAAQALTHEALIWSTEFEIATSNTGDANLVMPPRAHSDIEWVKQLAEEKDLEKLIDSAPRLLRTLLTDSLENVFSIFGTIVLASRNYNDSPIDSVVIDLASRNYNDSPSDSVLAVMKFYGEFSSMVHDQLLNNEGAKIAELISKQLPLLRKIQNQPNGVALSELNSTERNYLGRLLYPATLVTSNKDKKWHLTELGHNCVANLTAEERVANAFKAGTTRVVVTSAAMEPEANEL